MKFPLLAVAALLLGAVTVNAAPPLVIVVPSSSTQSYVLPRPQRPKPKTYDPYFYEVKSDKKKTIIKRDPAGNVTVTEKKKGKKTVTVTNRYGNVVYKETTKKKKK